MTLIVDGEPLTEWSADATGNGYQTAGFELTGYTRDRSRRRVTVFLSVHVLKEMGYWTGSEDDTPERVIERAAYADPEIDRLPKLENVYVAKFLLPWEK